MRYGKRELEISRLEEFGMRILIIENETYLAQSIMIKLSAFGHDCAIVSKIDVYANMDYDVILLSSGVCDDLTLDFIARNRSVVIILMISSINYNTIIKPIKAGACDYILKPFIIDELVRKIEHYRRFRDSIKKLQFYEAYFESSERHLDTLLDFDESTIRLLALPFVVQSTSKLVCDLFMMKYARINNLTFTMVKHSDIRQITKHVPNEVKDKFFYIVQDGAKFYDPKTLLDELDGYNAVISYVGTATLDSKNVIKINDGYDFAGQILSIKEYERVVIQRFKDSYSNTDLAKKLGISRKSLWEKKKKYEF